MLLPAAAQAVAGVGASSNASTDANLASGRQKRSILPELSSKLHKPAGYVERLAFRPSPLGSGLWSGGRPVCNKKNVEMELAKSRPFYRDL